MKTRGFTLIEAMAVVAIIGVLASLTVYTFSQVKRQGRDTRRKSDLAAISLAFQARYDNKTCTGLLGSQNIGYYPGREVLGVNDHWAQVSQLENSANDCGAFSEYLITIPEESEDPFNTPYRFDLDKSFSGVRGRHYRIVANLEKETPPTSQEALEFARMISVWNSSFGGQTPPNPNYNYIIGN